MVALLDLDDLDIDLDDETEVAYVVAKFQAMARLHGRTLEAEADLWALMNEEERDTYAAQIETVPLGGISFRGLN